MDMQLRNSDDLEAIDRATFFHPSTDAKAHAHGTGVSRIVTGGSGVFIEDMEGKRSLDGFGGLYCVNIGYGRMEIADAIHAQASKLSYYHAYAGHGSEPSIRLSAKIIEHAPKNMRRVYYGMSGSDANETQVKLVWYYNNVLGRQQKKKIISRQRGYHGSGLMTGSLTGLPVFHNAFDLPLPQVKHTHCAHFWKNAQPGMTEEAYSRWCADELDKLIMAEGPETVAAFIGEPVMGTGGLIPPPAGYWPEIQKVLKKHDVLLIADEVVTGFGRIGDWFGSLTYGMEPDLITVAKGLTSAYLPLSGVIVGERVWEVIEQGSDQFGPLGHGWTYSAHPLCTAAGLANLEIIEREDIIGHVREVGPYLQKTMQDALASHPIVGEVRGVGLLAAVEFARDQNRDTPFDPALKVGPKASAAALKHGLITRAMPHGDILGFAPPLVITKGEIDQLVEITVKAVNEVAAEI